VTTIGGQRPIASERLVTTLVVLVQSLELIAGHAGRQLVAIQLKLVERDGDVTLACPKKATYAHCGRHGWPCWLMILSLISTIVVSASDCRKEPVPILPLDCSPDQMIEDGVDDDEGKIRPGAGRLGIDGGVVWLR
jgi:hypothetical protein